MALLDKIVTECDRLLRVREIEDWDNALNGLQIENSGKVTRIGAAVDASMAAAEQVGVTGTPAWLLDGRFLLPGAQPHDVIERVVSRLQERPPPTRGP